MKNNQLVMLNFGVEINFLIEILKSLLPTFLRRDSARACMCTDLSVFHQPLAIEWWGYKNVSLRISVLWGMTSISTKSESMSTPSILVEAYPRFFVIVGLVWLLYALIHNLTVNRQSDMLLRAFLYIWNGNSHEALKSKSFYIENNHFSQKTW